MIRFNSIGEMFAGSLRMVGNALRRKSAGRLVLGLGLGLLTALACLTLVQIGGFGSALAAPHRHRHRHHGAAATPTATATPLPAQCEIPEGYTKLSKCIGSDPKKTVTIGGASGTGDCKGGSVNAYVDQALLSMGQITINAGSTLKLFDRTAQLPVLFDTTGIQVNGTLEIGSAACPIGTINPATTVTVTFKGPKDTNCTNNACPGYTKGIEVEPSGALRMYGAKGVGPKGVSWTYLGDAAGPSTYDAAHNVKVPAVSDSQIVVADDVTQRPGAWQAGDWIAVAGTGFDPFETEFVQIQGFGALTDKGRIVNLCTANQKPCLAATKLKFYHFGSKPPSSGTSPGCGNGTVAASYCDGADRNYGVDERAEVGLISRNIKLTADTPATGPDNHWGGEMKFLKGFAEVSVQGVELQKFGKDKLGSYPFHFHMDDNLSAAKVLINANSIDHSYNKCVAVHSTQNLTVSNNVCARIVGHIFYEEIGDEDNISFNHNLGLGAMSNSFDVNDSFNSTDNTGYKRSDLIAKYWWVGDNMVDRLNQDSSKMPFDGFNIADTDDQTNGTAGSCFQFGNVNTPDNGAYFLAKATPPCDPGQIYLEPASGFWIVNPSTRLHDNSIGGCQGEGKGYWYVPPFRGPFGNKKFIPVGTYSSLGNTHGEFTNNRVHGCDSGLYSGDQQNISAEALQPYQDGVKSATSRPVMGEFTGVTATRNRFRGVWLRPSFYTVKDGRLATNRDSVSLVTSGGPDGNYPGIYSLFKDSVVVGVSQNNVERWGPCPALRLINGFGAAGGWTFGCIDKTAAKKGSQGTGGDLINLGYPGNAWNFAGYMIYDGPVLIFHDRFVNFQADPTNLLTKDDVAYLNSPPPPVPPPPNGVYEGDAALGWFQGNISSYPVATASEELTWDNVDFRHQVYTQQVNISSFNDGDKNTAIIDLDGTLSGYKTILIDNSDCTDVGEPSACCTGSKTGTCNQLAGKLHPISLNNLELNAAGSDPGGSVDECQAQGKQDRAKEGRPTANLSPGEAGALEFQGLYPDLPDPGKSFCTHDSTKDDCRHDQKLTFTKDSTEFSGNLLEHSEMELGGRNGQGIWEPKVQSGYGYTVTTSPTKSGDPAGIPALVHVAVADTVKPNISADTPFYVRVGICYQGTGTNAANGHPKDGFFTLTRGYRSWGGGGVDATDQKLRLAYNQLDGQSNGLKSTEACFNLDRQNYVPDQNCPSVGIYPMLNGICPAGSNPDSTRKLCIFPTTAMSKAASLSDLTSDGKPVLDKYFYDPSTGWLFLNVAQNKPNATGASPLGACTGNAATDPYFCPSNNGGESYYVCPAEGCWDYAIKLNDPTWKPAASACPDPYAKYGTPATPALDGQLADAAAGTAVKRVEDGGLSNQFPHYKPLSEPTNCKTP